MLRRTPSILAAVVPKAEDYRKLTLKQLEELVELREKQVLQLKGIYEVYQNDVEGKYRKQVYDYHDKSIDFSKVHGQIQQRAMSNHREMLKGIREQDWKEDREKNLIFFILISITLVYYLWLQVHFFKIENADAFKTYSPVTYTSEITGGPGMWGGTWFRWDSKGWYARARKTPFEVEYEAEQLAAKEKKDAEEKAKDEVIAKAVAAPAAEVKK